MKLPIDIAQRLENDFGLDYSVLGPATIETLVSNRAEHHKLKDAQEYFDLLRKSITEFLTFTHGLLVSESWFFRDRLPFNFLIEVLEPKRRQFIRILSLGCASGEEPYSISMTLLDNGWDAHEFSILGIDLSPKSIEKAKCGEYTKIAFRGIDALGKEKHFERTPEGKYRVKNNIRKPVSFLLGNAIDPSIFLNEDPFDIIFFRNTLIYFTDKSRQQILNRINTLLKPKGTLFLGHADVIHQYSDLFAQVGPPAAFAYQKASKQQEVLPKSKSPTRK